MNIIRLFGTLAVITLFLPSCSQSGGPAGPASAGATAEATEGTRATESKEVKERNMTYAIQSSEGQHLGFLLMAGGETSGDCLFRSLPAESELFDSDEAKLLYEMQLMGEFSYLVAGETVTFKHPQFSRNISMTGGLLKAGDIEFRMERAKKS